MKREYPEQPIVSVGGVIFRENSVLLVQRAKPPSYRLWGLPGGVVELGETLQQAVQREIQEETGLHVQVLDTVAVLDRILYHENHPQRPQYHYILVFFLCEEKFGHLHPDSDVFDCRFITEEEMTSLEMSPPVKEVIYRARILQNHPRSLSIYLHI
ncbi:MAG: NUDIX hydrolase [Promethearchaeota archaeon]